MSDFKPVNLNFSLPSSRSIYDPEGPKKLKRRVPPVGFCDTIQIVNGVIQSVHGQGILFRDREIIHRHRFVEKQLLNRENRIYAYKTRSGSYILQQQATRGCTAAVTAMLALDHGKQANISDLRTRNLGTTETKLSDLKKYGLSPVVLEVRVDSGLNHLRRRIRKMGSAIVSIGGELGSHVVIVDRISKARNLVQLRDPYHGWKITVSKESFAKRLGFSKVEVIQVREGLKKINP